MSFNLRCWYVGERSREDRVDDCLKTILDSGCELLGVQEATTGWMKDLKNGLEGFAHTGISRGIDPDGSEGEYSAIFYKTDRFELKDCGNFWYSDTPEVCSKCWTSVFCRICSWGKFYDKKEDKEFYYFNTHLDCDMELSMRSIPIIKKHLDPVMDYPLFISGDFNFFEGKEHYKEITKFLRDSKHVAKDTMDCLTYHDDKPEKHEGEVIDFIYINDKVNAVKYRVCNEKINGFHASDHYAIYADLEY